MNRLRARLPHSLVGSAVGLILLTIFVPGLSWAPAWQTVSKGTGFSLWDAARSTEPNGSVYQFAELLPARGVGEVALLGAIATVAGALALARRFVGLWLLALILAAYAIWVRYKTNDNIEVGFVHQLRGPPLPYSFSPVYAVLLCAACLSLCTAAWMHGRQFGDRTAEEF